MTKKKAIDLGWQFSYNSDMSIRGEKINTDLSTVTLNGNNYNQILRRIKKYEQKKES